MVHKQEWKDRICILRKRNMKGEDDIWARNPIDSLVLNTNPNTQILFFILIIVKQNKWFSYYLMYSSHCGIKIHLNTDNLMCIQRQKIFLITIFLRTPLYTVFKAKLTVNPVPTCYKLHAASVFFFLKISDFSTSVCLGKK